jgi:hypothetical protein
MSANSTIIGTAYCPVDMCNWEVWSDGKAFSDCVDDDGMYMTAYRREDGQWYTSLVVKSAIVVKASPRLEELFSAYIGAICTDLIDPHRHLRRR